MSALAEMVAGLETEVAALKERLDTADENFTRMESLVAEYKEQLGKVVVERNAALLKLAVLSARECSCSIGPARALAACS